MLARTTTAALSADRTTFGRAPAVALHAGDLEAVFVPEAGMAGVSLRHRGEELLSRQAGLDAYVARGAVMGLPFLHPWANRLGGRRYATRERVVELPPDLPADENGLPIHGVLPRPWSLEELAAPDGAATALAILDFADPAFPFPHRVEQRIRLDAEALTITTTLHATGRVSVPVAFGFHPYLQLPGAARETWELTLPARRHVDLDARSLPSGSTTRELAETQPLGSRVFDDGYDALGPEPRFAVAGGGRTIAVTFLRGYPVAQVFAPPGQRVVCFEPMTAPVNALVSGRGLRYVAPGRRFTAAFEIRVA
jgi:aldose 1-epimerase